MKIIVFFVYLSRKQADGIQEEQLVEQKIVFFDIDGTIYMYGKEVPEDTKEAIRELRSRGHLAVLCTGRTKIIVFPEKQKSVPVSLS